MKKDEIENRDQELIKKFRSIIQNKEKPPAPKKFPLGSVFLFAALIIAIMLVFKHQPTPLFSKAPKPPSREQLVPVPSEQLTLNNGIKQVEAPLDTPEVPVTLTQRPTKDQNQAKLNASDSVLNNPVFEKKFTAPPSNQSVQGEMTSGIQIETIISCSSVTNKQYSRPKVKFSLAQDATPKIWMKVISEHPPFTLTHVYYVNGQKYCEVPLAIRYHHMRTWSSVTLRSFDHIGRWRVEVIDDTGTKLEQIEFTVVE